MSINANRLVNILPRVIGAGATGLETIGNVLTKNSLIPTGQMAIRFASATAVAEYFGATSDEYKFAAQYFTGFNNQQKGISALVISRRIDVAAAAFVKGGEVTATLAQFKAVTAGAFKIIVGGTEKAVSGVDLSACTSLSDVATAVATAITGVTGAYSSITGGFIFTTTATGATASISVASAPASGTDLSEMLALTTDAGAVVSAGSDALSAAENMNAIAGVTRNWVGLTTLYQADATEIEGLSAWVDQDDDYCFVAWSTDPNVCDPATFSSTVFAGLPEMYNCTFMLYGDQQDAAFILAIGAAIDWERVQGMVTWFGKTTSGLSPRVVSDQVSENLDQLRVTYIGSYAARNSTFWLVNRGCLTSTLYNFIDVLYGMIWLKSAIQTSILSGLTSVNRAPYTPYGYAQVKAWIQDPITTALRSGVIDTGLALSDSQKTQILTEVGEDISNDLYAKGYWYRIDDPSATVRTERDSPTIYIYYTYAGAIQKISAPLTAVL